MGCKCNRAKSCNGFCTFPTNGTLTSPAGIIWKPKHTNTNMFIIPESNYDRELYAETDIKVSDDLEIYFVKADKFEEFKRELENSNDLSNIHKQFNAIFQGFGNYDIATDNINIPEYLARNNTTLNDKNELTLSGFVISPFTPFNYSHTIIQHTLLTGYDWETAKKANFITDFDKKIIPGKNTPVLKAGYIAVFRVRNWWSNVIQCEGKIIAKLTHDQYKMPKKLTKVLSVTNNYDFIERNQGFFKYQQETLHKSNIYSIKINNSGLNPDTSKKLKTYTKIQVINKLCQADQPTLENEWTGNNRQFNLKYNAKTDSFYIQTYTNKFNAKLNFDLTGANLISFIALCDEIGWAYDEQTNTYYHKTEKINVDKINKIKANMRNILENAIRSSISKYMPVETTLWKIIYAGK